jgi:hypothetical protein
MVNGKQHTVRFHVDDLMSSHVDSKVNDEFERWLNKMYGTHGAVKVTQGVKIDQNILCQDNKSTMLLLNNGKRSSSKRTRAFNIRYFFLTDQMEKNHLAVEYCPTTGMVADYMSKPLQGKLFQEFRKAIMGH